MSKKITFALGNVWRWGKSKNRDELIKHIKHLNIDGVELTFGIKEDLYNLKLSKSNLTWLQSFSHNSIHAPFYLFKRTSKEQEIIKIFDLIARYYKLINAKRVIIHPEDLPEPRLLNKYRFNVSTENMSKKHRMSVAEMKKVFKKYPKIGLCLDVTHAYSWSKEETKKLVRAFKSKITQIHLSGYYRKKDHQSMRIVTKDFMYSIEPIFDLNVPIVIEEDIPASKDVKFLKEEVDYIRGLFV